MQIRIGKAHTLDLPIGIVGAIEPYRGFARLALLDGAELQAGRLHKKVGVNQGANLQLHFSVLGLVDRYRQRGGPLTQVRVAVEVGNNCARFIGREGLLTALDVRRGAPATGADRCNVDIALKIVGHEKAVLRFCAPGDRAKIVLGCRKQLSCPFLGRQTRRYQKNHRNARKDLTKHGTSFPSVMRSETTAHGLTPNSGTDTRMECFCAPQPLENLCRWTFQIKGRNPRRAEKSARSPAFRRNLAKLSCHSIALLLS